MIPFPGNTLLYLPERFILSIKYITASLRGLGYSFYPYTIVEAKLSGKREREGQQVLKRNHLIDPSEKI